MRKKVGTTLDEKVLAAAKELATRKDRRLNEVIEEALKWYLAQQRLGASGSVVEATAGSYSVSDEQLNSVLEEDFYAGQ